MCEPGGAEESGTTRRRARHDDLDALADLERTCFGADAWSLASLRDELESVPKTRCLVVAERSGEVIGYAALRVAAPTADLDRIAVHPRHRRRGLARMLLDELLDEARRRACEEVLLEVDAANDAALRLYHAYGFEVIATRRGYYHAGRGDALVLRLS